MSEHDDMELLRKVKILPDAEALAKATEDKDIFVVCLRDMPGITVVDGSTKVECGKCKHPIWVSPVTLNQHVANGAKVICMECARSRVSKADELMITREQANELATNLKLRQLNKDLFGE